MMQQIMALLYKVLYLELTAENAVYFPPASDDIDVYNGGITGIDKTKMTIFCAFKFDNSNRWTDGNEHFIFKTAGSTTDFFQVLKPVTNGILRVSLKVAGTTQTQDKTGMNSTDWIVVGARYKQNGADSDYEAWISINNGVPEIIGAADTITSKVWNNNIDSSFIGAKNAGSSSGLIGYAGHYYLFNEYLDITKLKAGLRVT